MMNRTREYYVQHMEKKALCITVLLHLVRIIQHSGVTWNTVPNESA